jgi:hypothetical protein
VSAHLDFLESTVKQMMKIVQAPLVSIWALALMESTITPVSARKASQAPTVSTESHLAAAIHVEMVQHVFLVEAHLHAFALMGSLEESVNKLLTGVWFPHVKMVRNVPNRVEDSNALAQMGGPEKCATFAKFPAKDLQFCRVLLWTIFAGIMEPVSIPETATSAFVNQDSKAAIVKMRSMNAPQILVKMEPLVGISSTPTTAPVPKVTKEGIASTM